MDMIPQIPQIPQQSYDDYKTSNRGSNITEANYLTGFNQFLNQQKLNTYNQFYGNPDSDLTQYPDFDTFLQNSGYQQWIPYLQQKAEEFRTTYDSQLGSLVQGRQTFNKKRSRDTDVLSILPRSRKQKFDDIVSDFNNLHDSIPTVELEEADKEDILERYGLVRFYMYFEYLVTKVNEYFFNFYKHFLISYLIEKKAGDFSNVSIRLLKFDMEKVFLLDLKIREDNIKFDIFRVSLLFHTFKYNFIDVERSEIVNPATKLSLQKSKQSLDIFLKCFDFLVVLFHWVVLKASSYTSDFAYNTVYDEQNTESSVLIALLTGTEIRWYVVNEIEFVNGEEYKSITLNFDLKLDRGNTNNPMYILPSAHLPSNDDQYKINETHFDSIEHLKYDLNANSWSKDNVIYDVYYSFGDSIIEWKM